MRAATMTGPDLFAELDDQADDAAELAAAERDRAARAERRAAVEAAPVADPAEVARARRAERLARETAELATRAEDAARHMAERRARPEVAAWRARFERAPYEVRRTRDGLPVWSTVAGWVCPSCGTVELDEDKLDREHGYDPDQPGTIPALASEFGDKGQCHAARLIARQEQGAADRAEFAAALDAGPAPAPWASAICSACKRPMPYGAMVTRDAKRRAVVHVECAPVAEAPATNDTTEPASPEAAARPAIPALDSASTLARVANPDPAADPDQAWLDRRYAGWVARQERRAAADVAEHAAEVDEDQADELDAEPTAEAAPAINPALKWGNRTPLRAPCEGTSRACEIGDHGKCSHKPRGIHWDGYRTQEGHLMYSLTAYGPGSGKQGLVLDPATSTPIKVNPKAHTFRCGCECHAAHRAEAAELAEAARLAAELEAARPVQGGLF